MQDQGQHHQAELEQAQELFFARFPERKNLRLADFNGEHAAAFRDAVRRIAGLLRYNWDEVFQMRVLHGIVGELVPCKFGEEPFPDMLVLDFQSSSVAGSSGERIVVLHAAEKVGAALDKIVDKLSSPKSPPITFAALDKWEQEERGQKRDQKAEVIRLDRHGRGSKT